MNPVSLRACALALACACGASADETCPTCPDSIWGTGADGNLVVESGDVVTLTRDMHYCHTTIEFLGFLDTAGYTVYVSGVLQNGGVIFDLQSGGVAGVGGAAGLGADPVGDDEQGCGLPTECTLGEPGEAGGAALLAGAGAGGNGGCGGSGGGGAYYDEEIEFDADGGCGGEGGRGGDGGGVVRIFAYRLVNEVAISADGGNGGQGMWAPDDHAQCGAEHEEITGGAPLDLSGGGGGGGTGGDGGDGGTVEITYAHLSGGGAITADGGFGGLGGAGGAHGGCLTFGAGGTSQSGCVNESCDGFGDGGDGEHFVNQCPTDGAPGADGIDGQPGKVTLRAAGNDCNGNGNPDDCDIRCQLSADCNRNGVPDSCDIASGTSADGDGNGVPDECVTPPDWHERFDDYAEGPLAGQGGWAAWDDDPAAGGFVVTADAWQSCPHALAVTGVNDAVRAFSGYTTGTWEFAASVFVPCELVEPQYLILLNTYESGGPKNWSLELGLDAVGASVHDYGSGAAGTLIPGEWNDVRVVVDLDRDVQTVYANGDAFVSKSWKDGASGAGTLEFAAIDLWGDDSDSVIWYDDLALTAVDPGGACCFLVGSCFHVDRGSVCEDIGGTYQGDGTQCEVIMCEDLMCVLPFGGGTIDELEPDCYEGYADVYNSGCNAYTEAFLPIGDGDHIGGTSGNYDGPLPCDGDTDCADQCVDGFCNTNSLLRDTDWYELTLDEPTRIRFGGVAEFPLELLLIDGTNGCDDRVTIDQRYADPCRAVSIVRDLEPGTYWLWVGTQAGGDLVDCESKYEITLDFLHTSNCVDTDGDGVVDFADLVNILANFGPCPDCFVVCGQSTCFGDVDADCQVTLSDLETVLAALGSECP